MSIKNERIFQTIGYFAGYVAISICRAILGPSLPYLASHTHAQLNQISFVFVAINLGNMIGNWQGGKLFDRIPGHAIMTIALITIGITLALIPTAPYLWLLAAIIMLLGIAVGLLEIGVNTLLIWVHQHRVGPFMIGLYLFGGIGAILSPLAVGRSVLLHGNIHWGYWLMALLVVPMILWLVRLPSPAAYSVPLDDPAAKSDPLLALSISILYFLYVGSFSSISGWLFSYVIAMNLAGELTAAYLNSAFWLALTAGRLAMIPLINRFNPRWVLAGNLLGGLLGMGIILLWPGSLAAVWLGTLVFAFLMASFMPTGMVLAQRTMTVSGQVTSWFMLSGSLGAILMPWLSGQLFTNIGPRAVMFVSATALITGLLVLGGYRALVRARLRNVKTI